MERNPASESRPRRSVSVRAISVCQLVDGYYVPCIDVTTDVRRRGRDLDIVIHRPAIEQRRDEAIAVRAHRTLRDAGVPASTISISCTD